MRVDLRSDTVTRPSAAMLQAMMNAPLGDDVLGDDPTVQKLEATAADRVGKEAALFVPSGTMANLLAMRVSTRAGDEVLMHADAHPFNYEAGGAAAFAGVQIRPLCQGHPFLRTSDVIEAIRPPNDHYCPATLLCAEDTVNRGGGAAYELSLLDELTDVAHARGLATHLDGARLFNAVVGSGISAERRCRGFDTVAFCFSKGLGAPIGSILCGDSERIHVARRMRKLLGGGMRQAGVIAAAALYALDHHVERLAQDHERAAALADGLRNRGWTVEPVFTNMVYVQTPDAASVVSRLAQAGVACFATAPTRIRLVLHLDVNDEGVGVALLGFGSPN